MIGWKLFAYTLIILAGLTAFRSRAKDPKAGFLYAGGFLTVFTISLLVLVTALPFLLTQAPTVASLTWGGVVNDTAQDVRVVGTSVNNALAQMINWTGQPIQTTVLDVVPDEMESPAAVPPTLSPETAEGTAVAAVPDRLTLTSEQTHTVQRGETLAGIAAEYALTVDELSTHNNLTNPNQLLIGQELKVPMEIEVTVTPSPTLLPTATSRPQPTPTAEPDFSPQLTQLTSYKRSGNIPAAEEVIRFILSQAPQQPQAVAYQAEIAAAQQLRQQWQTLGGEQDIDTLNAQLVGFEFELIAVEKAFGRSKWQEQATLRCTSAGWLYGTELTVPRGYTSQLGVDTVGQRFGGGS